MIVGAGWLAPVSAAAAADEVAAGAQVAAGKDLATRDDIATANNDAAGAIIEEVLVTGVQPGPGLWRVTRPTDEGEHVLLIMGQYRTLPKEMEWRSTELEAAIASSQELLAEPGGRFAGDARVPGTHRAFAVWTAATAALDRRREALAGGRLDAPGAAGDSVQPALLPEGLTVTPPCKHCDYPGLCGRGQA